MKKLMLLMAAAALFCVGFASTGVADEPSVKDTGKQVVEGNRRHYRPRRGGGNFWIGGGSWGPRYYGPGPGYYYGPRYYAPPRVVYVQPAPVYVQPAPVYSYPGTVYCR